MSDGEVQPLVEFLKALADGNRLRIVGLLAHRPHTVEELATVLELRASTVSHHLAKLNGASLVTAGVRGHYHEYALDLDALQQRVKTLASTESVRHLAAAEGDADPYEQKVLSTFLDAKGRLAGTLPMKRKKFEVLLRYALRLFEDGGPWNEREVNRRLKKITKDVASFRRGFIDHRLMTRDRGGENYRRV
ncbi:MAG: metalloregulator ArsR/SmtB family transcription factor [Myxococcota bacterium]